MPNSLKSQTGATSFHRKLRIRKGQRALVTRERVRLAALHHKLAALPARRPFFVLTAWPVFTSFSNN